MNVAWISADTVSDGTNLLPDHAIEVVDGRVSALRPTAEVQPSLVARHHPGLLTPGFFDIQVNGGGGVLLNGTPTVAALQAIAAAHRRFGTVAILPTVITDRPAVLEAAVAASLAAQGTPGIAGLHIEGPHLSTARRGTHEAGFIRPLDAHTLGLIRQLCDSGLPTLVTVAPESATPAQIGTLTEMGAVVALGHSDATAGEAQACLAAGATGFTHLFNAMSPMLNRAPGVTGAAIMSEAWCSIIADGHHVDPLMIRLATRARPVADRMIAVSDAMATIGGPEAFDLYGQTIRLDAGRLINAEGSLAGAHLTMADALRNLVSYGLPLDQVLRMCRANPAAFMGLETQFGLIGLRADDLVLLDADLSVASVGLPDLAAPVESPA